MTFQFQNQFFLYCQGSEYLFATEDLENIEKINISLPIKIKIDFKIETACAKIEKVIFEWKTFFKIFIS